MTNREPRGEEPPTVDEADNWESQLRTAAAQSSLDRPVSPAAVVWAYRLILGREPEGVAVVTEHCGRFATRRELVEAFLSSEELRLRSGYAARSAELQLRQRVSGLLATLGLQPDSAPGLPPPAGCWRDAVGVSTRVGFCSDWRERSGRIIGRPPDDELAEWVPLLESLVAANAAPRPAFCMLELGAGHGPWLARAGVVWQRLHPEQAAVLVGVEGEPNHYAFLCQHLADNRLVGPTVRPLLAAVGTGDNEGFVEFETAADPARDYGTRLVEGAPGGLPRVANPGRVRVPAHSLTALAAQLPTIDLVHVDIQGDELAVLSAAGATLRSQVRRVCVGTHGRAIEAGLLALMPELGFELGLDLPCVLGLHEGRPLLALDGVQYWVNRSLCTPTR